MEPDQIRQTMARLGVNGAGLARLLRLGKGGSSLVGKWLSGKVVPAGPTQVAIELLAERAEPGWIRLGPEHIALLDDALPGLHGIRSKAGVRRQDADSLTKSIALMREIDRQRTINS